jgi:ParB family chromosome partitioning protein
MSMDQNNIQMIPTARIFPHPDNPRKDLGDLTELTDSIRAMGVMQNLTVVPWADVNDEAPPVEGAVVTLIGHRRAAAARAAGVPALPCVLKTGVDRKTQMSVMLLENLQRADLTIIEQAHGFQMMMDLGSSVKEISEKTGFAERTVQRRLQIATLPEDVFGKSDLRIEDYVAIAQLPAKQKKTVLRAVGTNNFKWELKHAQEEAAYDAAFDELLPLIEQTGIPKFDGPDNYQHWKDERLLGTDIKELAAKKEIKQPADLTDVYWMRESRYFYIYRKQKRTKNGKPAKSTREIGADRKRAEMKEIRRRMYESRRAFIKDFTAEQKNKSVIERQFMKGLVRQWLGYTGVDYAPLWELIGKKNKNGYSRPPMDDVTEKLDKGEGLTLCAWLLTGDSKSRSPYYEGYGTTPPYYNENSDDLKRLNETYAFLCELGYVMSDEEKAMMDGTHELYGKKKKKTE